MVAQMIKSPHALLETWVQSLGQEDPLEKGMATHSSILFFFFFFNLFNRRLVTLQYCSGFCHTLT